MSTAVKPINILDTAYFEDRVIAIAHRVKKESGFVRVNEILKAMGFSTHNGPMHNKIAEILDANGFSRKKQGRRSKPKAAEQVFSIGWSQWTAFTCYATPDQNTPCNP